MEISLVFAASATIICCVKRFPPTSQEGIASEIRRQWKIPKKHDSGGIFRHVLAWVRLSGLGIRFVWRRWTARQAAKNPLSCTRITRPILSSYPAVSLPSRPSWSSFVSYSNPESSYESGCSEISPFRFISSRVSPLLFNSSAITRSSIKTSFIQPRLKIVCTIIGNIILLDQ